MRTNQKTTSKYYDTLEVAGWNANFEYETVNAYLAGKVMAIASKEQKTITVLREDNGQTQVIASADFDTDVVAALIAEIDDITEQFKEPKQTP